MELRQLAEVDLAYLTLTTVDYGPDAQYYGTLEGSLTGERLIGTLSLTNLAPGRSDNVNQPTLRGLLTTSDGAEVWVELDGIATLRAEDRARVFVTSARFRTGSERYGWLNTVFGVVEGVLDTDTGKARGQMFECRPTMESHAK